MDENGRPLSGAAILFSPINRGTVTDADGYFTVAEIVKGSYNLSVSFLGYQDFHQLLLLTTDVNLTIKMVGKTQSLSEVVVIGDNDLQRKKESVLSLEIVDREYLKQHLGGSLMQSLERLAGVSTISIGSGQSKPVIRGLGFNRVVVVENGIRHEGQQWGDDHGLEIDQYAANKVEVLKGPASLRYGSDAMGGVVDVKQEGIPDENTFTSTVDLTGKTNNNLLGTSVSLAGRRKALFAVFRATLLDYGDYKVPTDSIDIYSYRAPLYKHHLRNTAGYEHDLHFSFGYTQPSFQSRFYISNISSKSGFFANAHGLEPRNVDAAFHDKSDRDIQYPYHQVNHFKVINKSQWAWKAYELRSEVGFQRNFRQEWSQYISHGYMPAVYSGEAGFDPDLERQFEKYVYSANIESSYYPHDQTSLTAGISSAYHDNRIGGRGFIIPTFDQFNVGTFLFGKYAFTGKRILQIGIRYDYGSTNIDSYYDWFTSPVISGTDTTYQYLLRAGNLIRNFSNLSWSVGYNYPIKNWLLKANVGKSFRMPIAKELGANGVNYHHFSYEVGDPDLSPEVSYQLDAGVEYSAEKFSVALTPFINYFSNYIYLNPTAEHDRLYGNGNQVFYYSQSKVLRYGGEIHAHYPIFKCLNLGLMGEYVYALQLSGEKKGYTLPFSPPVSVIFNIRCQINKHSVLEDAYVSLDFKVATSQNRIVPPEEVTNGYQVVNLGVGGVARLNKHPLSVSFQVQNLFNTRYF